MAQGIVHRDIKPSFSTTYIAVDATYAYWTGVDVLAVPIGGGPATRLATYGSTLFGVAVDAACVYWATGTVGTVMKIAKP